MHLYRGWGDAETLDFWAIDFWAIDFQAIDFRAIHRWSIDCRANNC
jgi:hypothetical protein